MLRGARIVPSLVVPAMVVCGCSDDSGPKTVPERLTLPCEDPDETIYMASPPESWSSERRGEIAGCRYDRLLPAEELAAHFDEVEEFPAVPMSTAVHEVDFSYWTERGPGEPILTSALLLFPETLRAEPSPVLVLGHGSVGIADSCAPSKDDPNGFDKDWKALAYMLAGDGWLVVMPDLPGIGTPGPGTWNFSIDEGHAILDATRAIRNLVEPGTLSDANAFVGHSVGAHATLSAQAMLDDYGARGEVVANLTFSPFWLPSSVWGALVSPYGEALLNSVFMSLTLQYFYGHAHAYDGEEAAKEMFVPDKAGAVVNLLETKCYREVTSEEQGPPSLGIERGEDVFPPEFLEQVGTCGLSDTCEGELADLWRERWVVDRPTPSLDVPVVHYMGGADDFVLPGFQACGLERLEAAGVPVSLCVDAEGGHAEVIPRNAQWARAYLAHQLLGEPAPEPCPGADALESSLACSLPIAHSVDPADP